MKKYDIIVPNDEATPGTYFLTIQARRNNYATAFLTIEVTIVFTDFNLILYALETGYPGETITINAYVEDNKSIPVSDVVEVSRLCIEIACG